MRITPIVNVRVVIMSAGQMAASFNPRLRFCLSHINRSTIVRMMTDHAYALNLMKISLFGYLSDRYCFHVVHIKYFTYKLMGERRFFVDFVFGAVFVNIIPEVIIYFIKAGHIIRYFRVYWLRHVIHLPSWH